MADVSKLYIQTVDGERGSPAPLPFRVMFDGWEVPRTDPTQWTPEELEAWGFEVAPDEPAVEAGHIAVWRRDPERWEVVELPPVVAEPLRITKSDFSRLLTLGERVTLNAKKAEIRAMTPADYADPAKQILVSLQIVIDSFELPAEFIELDHPDTVYGVGTILVGAGILTAARAAQVLANTPPA